MAWTPWQPAGDSFCGLISSLSISAMGGHLDGGSRQPHPPRAPAQQSLQERRGVSLFLAKHFGQTTNLQLACNHKPQSKLVWLKSKLFTRWSAGQSRRLTWVGSDAPDAYPLPTRHS